MAKALLCTQCLGVIAATPIGDTAVDQGGIHRRIIAKEATEEDIKAILAHDKLAPVDADALAKGAIQWFCKRFALLKDSKILDQYTVPQIVQNSVGYDLDIQVDNSTGQDRIVFPAEKAPAKKLLQFLNEELFRGAITERLFETNSKRIAD